MFSSEIKTNEVKYNYTDCIENSPCAKQERYQQLLSTRVIDENTIKQIYEDSLVCILKKQLDGSYIITDTYNSKDELNECINSMKAVLLMLQNKQPVKIK